MANISNRACFTGHRIIAKQDQVKLRSDLDTTLRTLVSYGVKSFICGGAIGFDTLAARAVLALKEEFGDIKLVLILPCKNQDAKWKPSQRQEYAEILSLADHIEYTGEEYTPTCMHERNRRMVDLCGYCISYLRRKSSGTQYTVSYAEKNGRVVIGL